MGKRNRERIERIKLGTEFSLSVQRGSQPTKSRPVKFTPSKTGVIIARMPDGSFKKFLANRQERRHGEE